jgi:flagellar basal-body rod modification protein FlgD
MNLAPTLTNHSSLAAASHTVASALSARAPAAKANAATNGTSGADAPAAPAAATDPSTITSSDFLTLLVSELQNQDPTQPTDPNAYISQLVGVNSLQQLISIDQGITSLNSSVSPPAAANTGSSSGSAAPAIASGSVAPANGS